ncbi:hypothetical protein OAC78_06855 [Litorivicinus sp.]|jgi:hypothetical protein|nr:hypothetical protein [Litorivicinus sp.]MDB9863072.1 hypothetical protein [Litorivicinus sp.]MDC1207833.1 hypothetical protein [Litorivicinus sp.]MDC1239687.1 hypothetical protein [Litorivicinus sp.]MDC1466478.1 hypothetical protein [Litorivicinus sp.]
MLDHLMLGLGFAGGLIYLTGYLCLTRGWISGDSYVFHGISVFSCSLLALSSGYSHAWASAVINTVFVIVGSIYISRKALTTISNTPDTITNVADLSFNAPDETLEIAV